MKQQPTLKSLQLVHKAMLLGQLVFAAIAFFLSYTGSFPASLNNSDQLLQVIAVLLSAGGFFIGTSLFKKRMERLRDDTSEEVNKKAEAYRSASVIQWALLEGPSLFCIICFLLAGNYAFLALSAVLMLLFFMAGPSKLKIMMLLRLSEQEMENF